MQQQGGSVYSVSSSQSFVSFLQDFPSANACLLSYLGLVSLAAACTTWQAHLQDIFCLQDSCWLSTAETRPGAANIG